MLSLRLVLAALVLLFAPGLVAFMAPGFDDAQLAVRLVARSLATSPEDLASQLQHVAVQACLELQRAFAASGRIGGCTATLVLQAGRLVTVASLGSSRCVLSTGSGGLATLSAQHVISANQQELKRLLKAGCHVAPQEPGSPGPAASPRSGGGVLRPRPGGCTGGVGNGAEMQPARGTGSAYS